MSAWLTTGVKPIICPPTTYATLNLDSLKAPIVHLRLHGMPNQPYLYGDNWLTALSAEQVRNADFSGCTVFLEGCYGLGMAKAFLQAGALSVVGSSQPTFGKRLFLGPSSKMARAWIRAVTGGMTAQGALQIALEKTGQSAQEWAAIDNSGGMI